MQGDVDDAILVRPPRAPAASAHSQTVRPHQHVRQLAARFAARPVGRGSLQSRSVMRERAVSHVRAAPCGLESTPPRTAS